jgi:hypothetical protein
VSLVGEVALALTGVKGLIKWSYYTAGQVEGYAVYRYKDGRWSMTATLVLSDAFKMKQRPLIFVAPYIKDTCASCLKVSQVCTCREPQRVQTPGEWRWPITSLEMGAVTGQIKIEAVLGPQL